MRRDFHSWFLAAAILSTAPALSQDVVNVRAGEHATYSRIAIPVAPDAQWEFTTFDRQATLRIPGSDTNFDVSGVFDRIPKTRVLNINSQSEGGDTEIQLNFACPCTAKATTSGGYIFVDVYDPDARDAEFSSESEQVAEVDEPQEVQSQSALSPPPRPIVEEVAQDLTGDAPKVPSSESSPADKPVVGAQKDPEAQEVADLLIEQLRRAADQGLVELQEPPMVEPDEPKPAAPQEPEPLTSSLEPYQENADGMEELAARLQRALGDATGSGLNDAVRLQLPEEKLTAPMPPIRDRIKPEDGEVKNTEHCLDDYHFDFSVLEPGRRPVEQVIDLRSRLLGEFDNPDSTAALELARLYIALGMGVEARALATEFVEDPTQKAVLEELAWVVEGEELMLGSRIELAAGCPGPSALWRTAGISKGETQPVPEPDQIVDNLANLPVELRRRIVPKVVASFIARDQIAAAEASFSILDRAAGFHGPEHEFQRAALLRLSGQVADAEAIFYTLSNRSDPTGPEALVALIQSIIERGSRVPPELIGDAAAMARQFRDDPLGPVLRHAEIVAKAGNGQFGEALTVVAREIEESPDIAQDYVSVADRLFTETRSKDVSPGAYATAVFDHMTLLKRQDISTIARLTVAEELIGIGLPAAATSLLGPVANPATDRFADDASPSERDARNALARAYLKMDQPEKTLDVLPSEPSDEETAIRVLALTKLGRHQAALAEASLAQNPPDTATIGFRAGAWDLATQEQNLNGALARYMLRLDGASEQELTTAQNEDLRAVETPTEPIDGVTLEIAGALRTQSESIRRVLAEALDDPS